MTNAKPNHIKITALRAPALALAGLLALILGLWELSGRDALNPVLEPAETAAKEIALTTAGVYVSLRTINAVLSAAQEAEVGGSIGVQATLQPFKVLEPIDDTVERVTDVLFAVAAGATLAAVGFEPVAALGATLFGLGLLALATGAWYPSFASAMSFGSVAARLGAAFGLALPLAFVLGVNLGERLTKAQWQSAMSQLNEVAAEAKMLIGDESAFNDKTPAVPSDAQGLFERLRAQANALGEGVEDTLTALGRYGEAAWVFLSGADDLFGALLVIIAVFALCMLVLPALLLWGFMILMRRTLGTA